MPSADTTFHVEARCVKMGVLLFGPYACSLRRNPCGLSIICVAALHRLKSPSGPGVNLERVAHQTRVALFMFLGYGRPSSQGCSHHGWSSFGAAGATVWQVPIPFALELESCLPGWWCDKVVVALLLRCDRCTCHRHIWRFWLVKTK